MKKIILPALICSAIFANLANAEDISKPTSTPGNYDPTSVKDVIKDEVGLKKRKKKKVQVSDAVKKELREYKAKKKALYNSLSPEAKNALNKHKKRQGYFKKSYKKKQRKEKSIENKVIDTPITRPGEQTK